MTTTALNVRFVVLGRPQSKGSKEVMPVKGPRRFIVRDANPKAKPWAQAISAIAREHHHDLLINGPVVVTLAFYFARPKGHYGTGRNVGTLRASAPREMTTMPDVDKLARCALDALTGIVFRDDAQIVDLHAGKRYGEPERAEFTVRELETQTPPERTP
jgi:Holliday junction resolvase RusA-like endonuclease